MTDLPLPDFLDVIHSLWIEWRQTTLQTTAMLAMAGGTSVREADAHADFDDLFSPAAPKPQQDPEERRRLIAALAG